MFKKIGPGVLIAAAFIGPGTVTVCTLAGASFGHALLWAVLLSLIATMVLQEMSARLGVITQRGLADAIKGELSTPWVRYLLLGIIMVAIVVGNAAYEAGNIGGATLGMDAIFGTAYSRYYPLVIGVFAFLLLYLGSYKTLEKVFVALVVVMSLSFLLAALMTKPNVFDLLIGMLVPTIPEDGLLTIIALVGTTVVPYNLFLHASLVGEKWKSKEDLGAVRKDTVIAIGLGGLVSMAIIMASATIQGKEITGIIDLAQSLEPLYGSSAVYLMGIGLFAAGVTSAITAPLAAAYVANSCFGWQAGLRDKRFRFVWILILVLGVFFLSFGIRPIQVIKFAQIANGVLLPVIAIFLMWIVNKVSVMGSYKNTMPQNILGGLIVLLTIFLGTKSILKVIGLF